MTLEIVRVWVVEDIGALDGYYFDMILSCFDVVYFELVEVW